LVGSLHVSLAINHSLLLLLPPLLQLPLLLPLQTARTWACWSSHLPFNWVA
jgi:hypothetical protein